MFNINLLRNWMAVAVLQSISVVSVNAFIIVSSRVFSSQNKSLIRIQLMYTLILLFKLLPLIMIIIILIEHNMVLHIQMFNKVWFHMFIQQCLQEALYIATHTHTPDMDLFVRWFWIILAEWLAVRITVDQWGTLNTIQGIIINTHAHTQCQAVEQTLWPAAFSWGVCVCVRVGVHE